VAVVHFSHFFSRFISDVTQMGLTFSEQAKQHGGHRGILQQLGPGAQAASKLMTILKAWECQTGHLLKAVRKDHGTEYNGLDKWCAEQGVKREKSVAHMVQQSARFNRTICERTLAAHQDRLSEEVLGGGVERSSRRLEHVTAHGQSEDHSRAVLCCNAQHMKPACIRLRGVMLQAIGYFHQIEGGSKRGCLVGCAH
jgi:hypothetical protein